MSASEKHNRKSHRPRRKVKARTSLYALVLSLITVAVGGFTAGLVIAATDPDWASTEPTNISQSDTVSTWEPAIGAGPSGQITVAWPDISSGSSIRDIYAASSDDWGRNWDPPTRVLATADASQLPHVVTTGNDPERTFAVWADRNVNNNTFRIYEAELGGGSRQVPLPSADSPSGITTGPRLAASSDTRLHVVFNAGRSGSSHILYSSRMLADAEWPSATRIYTSAYGVSWFPALAVRSDAEGVKLHVVWEQMGETIGVKYKQGTANGPEVDWTDAIALSDPNISSVKPDIAVSSNGDVHIVWGEAGTDRDYYVRYCRYDPIEGCSDSRRVDSRAVYVNEISPSQSAPRLALWEKHSEVLLCVAWPGFRDREAVSPEEDVLVSCSQDGGQNWKSPQRMSAFHPGVPEDEHPSVRPNLVFDASGTLHAAWQQRRVDIASKITYYQIYYAHSLNQVFLPLVIRNS